jgi:hypothetical protein
LKLRIFEIVYSPRTSAIAINDPLIIPVFIVGIIIPKIILEILAPRVVAASDKV